MNKKQKYFCKMNLDACRDLIANYKYNVNTTSSGYRFLDRTSMHPCPNTFDGAMKVWGKKYIDLKISTKRNKTQKTYAYSTNVESHGNTPIEAIYRLVINQRVYNNPKYIEYNQYYY